jgi:hypothetical protein
MRIKKRIARTYLFASLRAKRSNPGPLAITVRPTWIASSLSLLAMTKRIANKDPTLPTGPNKMPTLDDYLTHEEFRARFEAEKAKVQQHYCTLFAFWRSCRFKPCRRAHACRGDLHECLQRSVHKVSRADQFVAREKLLQATPRNLPAPELTARQLMLNSFDDSAGAFAPRDIPPGWTRLAARGKRQRTKR